MAWLYDWVADILCFLVLMSLLEALLPSKKYIRYIRFFAGVVLILVAVQPLSGGLGLAEEIDRYFGEFTFQTEVRDIRRDVLGIEEERRQQMFAAGEDAAAADVEAMVREAGFVPVRTKVEIEKDAEDENYGVVRTVSAVVRRNVANIPEGEAVGTGEKPVRQEAGENAGQNAGENAGQGAGENTGQNAGENIGQNAGQEATEATGSEKIAVSTVKIEITPVELGEAEGADNPKSLKEQESPETADSTKVPDDSKGPETAEAPDISLPQQDPVLYAASADLAELKRKVEHFYELEPEDVEIQLEGR